MRRVVPLLALLLIAPLALGAGQVTADPVDDQALRVSHGYPERLPVGCSAPAADIVQLEAASDGAHLTLRVRMAAAFDARAGADCAGAPHATPGGSVWARAEMADAQVDLVAGWSTTGHGACAVITTPALGTSACIPARVVGALVETRIPLEDRFPGKPWETYRLDGDARVTATSQADIATAAPRPLHVWVEDDAALCCVALR